MTPRRTQGGITLLELLLAMAVTAFMMLLTWASIRSTIDAKLEAEEFQDRANEIRVAMGQMARDLESAYISANENQGREADYRRTIFLGSDSGSVDELRFSSLSKIVLWADASESEQTMIWYYGETARDRSGVTNLMRREARRLSEENWREIPAEVDVLLRDVKRVEFEYFDFRDKEWKRRWNTTAADAERGRLPTYVRVTIEVPAGQRTRTYRTTVRLMLQEELRFFAN